MISGTTVVPSLRPASIAASKMARACISAISGKAYQSRQPRWPSIGLNSLKPATLRFEPRRADAHGRRHLADGRLAVRQKFVQAADRAGGWSPAAPAMISNSSMKSLRCMGRSLASAARLPSVVVGEDHLAHRHDAALLEEHMLGAAKPDAVGAEGKRAGGRRWAYRRWRAPSCGGTDRPSPSASRSPRKASARASARGP